MCRCKKDRQDRGKNLGPTTVPNYGFLDADERGRVLRLSGKTQTKELTCSFCEAPQSEVKRLIAGPGVYICDRCIHDCLGIIEDSALVELVPPSPRTIKSQLDNYVIGQDAYVHYRRSSVRPTQHWAR